MRTQSKPESARISVAAALARLLHSPTSWRPERSACLNWLTGKSKASGDLRSHDEILHIGERDPGGAIDLLDAGDAMVPDAGQAGPRDDIAVVADALQLRQEPLVVDQPAERRRRFLERTAIRRLREIPGAVVRQQDVLAAGADRLADVVVALPLLEQRGVEAQADVRPIDSRIISSVSS